MTDQLTTDSEQFRVEREPNSSNGVSRPATGTDIDDRLSGNRRRWPVLLAGVVLGCAATGGTAVWLDRDSASDEPPVVAQAVELDTVAVEQRDLIEEVDWSGALAAGVTTSIASPTAGIVTGAPAAGAAIGRGDVVAWVDGRPVVALFGSVPMWRDLGVGAEGDDVRQLETNLAVLGFDSDGEATIDREYTSATAEMVEAWQTSLGVDGTGAVAKGDVVVVAGPSSVTSAPVIGSSVLTGAPLATTETPAVWFDVVGRELSDDDSAGAIDSIAAVGEIVEHGTVLFTADGMAVVAVIDVSLETRAVLDAMETGDIEQLESVLAEIGFDPDDVMEIDDEADLATAAAVIRWEESEGLPATGSLDFSDYVVVPNDRVYSVGSAVAGVGDTLGDGVLVVTLESPTLSLTAEVAVTEIDEFEIGDTVVVTQVDESVFDAGVADIGDATTESVDGGDPTVTVTFEVASAPEDYVSGTVTITTESGRIDGATVVPTRSLVTLREGGFAVEISNQDGTTTLVGVELGTFDDGVVEIVGGDIAPGDLVVVPS